MATTRPEDAARPSSSSATANVRRSDQPLFAARKRETKYFSLSGANSEPQKGVQERDAGSGALTTRAESREAEPNATARHNRGGSEGGAVGMAPTTLKSAWERALLEEESEHEGMGSPSPAARPRTGSRELDRRRMERIRNGRGLDLRRQSASPRLQHGQDDTVGSGSLSGSVAGDTEDGEEDEMDRKIRQFARDEERARRLAQAGGLFAKANVGQRVEQTEKTLQRKTSGTNDAEPGVRVPAQWGRKARRSDNKWLQRIISPDSSVEIEVPPGKVKDDTIDWVAAAADTAVPTVERDGEGQLTPPRSRPTSVQPENTSPAKSLWDADMDFTARSVMGGDSPQLRIRSSKIDEIRAREIESVSKHAVATARLEEIRERLSEDRSLSPELLKSTAKEPAREEMKAASPAADRRSYRRTSTESFEIVERGEKALETGPSSKRLFGEMKTTRTPPEVIGVDSSKEVPRGRRPRSRDMPITARKALSPAKQEESEFFHERTILEEEGEKIPGTPVTIFRNAEKEAQAHKREDSYDTLRRLAAITSQSPSPGLIRHEDKKLDDVPKQIVISGIESKRHSRSSSLPKSDVDPEERIVAERDLFEIPDNRSERNSIREPSPTEDEPVEETPRPKPNPLTMPTPLVTGAWIDTPAATLRQSKVRPPSPKPEAKPKAEEKPEVGIIKASIHSSRSSSRSRPESTTSSHKSSGEEATAPNPLVERLKPRPTRPRPPLTNSAPPSSAAADLMRIQREAALDDSTLDDFAELLSAETPESSAREIDANSTTILERGPDPEKDEKGRPLSGKERERRLQEAQIEKMRRNLGRGLESIRDAKRGIERLEGQVSATAATMAKVKDPVHAARSGVQCQCSACMGGGSVYHLSIPVPRLWFWDSTRSSGMRFTWLGLVVAMFLAWYVAESVAFAFIGKPEFSSGGNYDINGPLWGYALPRLADRCTLGLGSWSIRAGKVAVGWVWEVWTAEGRVQEAAGETGKGKFGRDRWNEGSIYEDETL
jgi:hypothetical protein